MIVNQRLQLVVVHHPDNSLGQFRHVAIATLKLKPRLSAEAIVLGGGRNVGRIHPEQNIPRDKELLKDADQLALLCFGVTVSERACGYLFSFGHSHKIVDVGELTASERCEDRICGQGVFNVTQRKRALLA